MVTLIKEVIEMAIKVKKGNKKRKKGTALLAMSLFFVF
jgi:hypothetical protein